MPQPSIHQTILINADCARVWQLLTDPLQMGRWLSDDGMTVASGFVKGQPITFRGLLHNRPYEARGTVIEFEPQKKFTYTFWTSLSEIADSPENYSVFEFILRRKDNATELGFTGRHLATEAIYAHHRFYWQVTLHILKQLAESKAEFK